MSDFEGTLARPEFYALVRGKLLPPATPDYWAEYRAGRMNHLDALRRYPAAAEGGKEALIAITREMHLEPRLPELLPALRRCCWEVVVVSAGCDWYIRRLLREAGVTLPVYANPGEVKENRLIMQPPVDSPFCLPQTGIDKCAVVRSMQEQNRPRGLRRRRISGSGGGVAGSRFPTLRPQRPGRCIEGAWRIVPAVRALVRGGRVIAGGDPNPYMG